MKEKYRKNTPMLFSHSKRFRCWTKFDMSLSEFFKKSKIGEFMHYFIKTMKVGAHNRHTPS